MTRIRGFALAAGAALSAAGAAAQNAEPAPAPPRITVSASAEVSAQPDEAVVRLGVFAQAPDAAAAQNQVNGTMQAILGAMRGLGVAERFVRTEDLTLSPIYAEQRPLPDSELQVPRVVGYRASNVVSVTVDALDRIGEIIDAGIGAGANQLQGISFRLKNNAAARSEAMRRAVDDARMQASAIAEGLDVRLGSIREVVAGGYDVRAPAPYVGARYAAAEMAATPVQAGEVSVTASVTVTYDLVVDSRSPPREER